MLTIPNIEQQPLPAIKKFQEEKLMELLAYLKKNSLFYQNLFKAHQINIDNVRILEDLISLPVTTKDDLQLHNGDFYCVPKSNIVDYSTTSGTLGEPVTIALTDKDLDRLAYNEAISFACAGITENDTVQLMTTMDRRFMAGMAYFLGIRKLGASIIRVGAGIPEMQWDSILKYKPTYLVAVPSFLLKLIAYAKKNGIDYRKSGVKGVICIGEAIRDNEFNLNLLGNKIVSNWPLKLYSTYASTEMSTAFTECEYTKGGHHHPELIIVEILDDNNQPVSNGDYGELTITTLGVEAMPLLRFKTGDLVKAFYEPCQCGRNSLRLSPVLGRKKQMVKYKGTTLYPPVLFDLLNNIDGVENYLIEISTNAIGTDQILIKIGSEQASDELLKTVRDHCRAKLRVAPDIQFCDIEEINLLRFPEMSRKPVLFLDKR